jgi:hypothetical protein
VEKDQEDDSQPRGCLNDCYENEHGECRLSLEAASADQPVGDDSSKFLRVQ